MIEEQKRQKVEAELALRVKEADLAERERALTD
jgi:hypothetical protein